VNPVLIGVITFAFAFGGVLLGTRLRAALPEGHLDDESKDVIKLGIGLVATMTALVLGLVTASAKNSFDAVDSAVKDTAVQLLALDRLLARYGPETSEIREALKQVMSERIVAVWPDDSSRPMNLDPLTAGMGTRAEMLGDAIRMLEPRDALQRALQPRAADLVEGMLQSRWLALIGTEGSVPLPFLAVLLVWITVTFVAFGMFALNRTAVAVLFVCAVSIGGALFLVLEMDGPFDGLLRVSSDPFRMALTHLSR
jgi:hypothetical protein